MRKKVNFQLKGQAFRGEDFIYVKNVLTIFERAPVSSRVLEGSAVWLSTNFMSVPASAGISSLLTFLSNDPNNLKDTVTSCVRVLKHLLRCYDIDAAIVNTDEDI